MKDGQSIIIQKDVTFEYVSITDTLKKVLENKDIQTAMAQFDEFSRTNNIMQQYFNDHPLFKNKNGIRILLYYDDVEFCNALGDSAGIYKGGMFYFLIANLSRKHNSNLKNIFLVAVAHSEDLKTFGYNKVLEMIRFDIKNLETNGIKIETDIFRASIAQCIGDNLAIHQLFGQKQSYESEKKVQFIVF
jgi:hypothetical protein